MSKTILGIDPGSRVTGLGVISTNGTTYRCLAFETIRVMKADFAIRLQQIFIGIGEAIAHYCPDDAAIEQVFMHKNANSALKLGQARGAAMVAISSKNIPLAEYSPRQIKQAVVGYGAAPKEQVQEMVKRLLGLNQTPAVDAADALAVAICHANTNFSWAGIQTQTNDSALTTSFLANRRIRKGRWQ